MSKYTAKIAWKRQPQQVFTDNKYSRGHTWEFDGGAIIDASSAPAVVPLPYSIEANVDPEEVFIASLSSCHMLFFLANAGKRGFMIDEYIDNAIGIMEKDTAGKVSITTVTLHPQVTFLGEKQPTLERLEAMHHQSHEQCFIANSVKTQVTIEIVL